MFGGKGSLDSGVVGGVSAGATSFWGLQCCRFLKTEIFLGSEKRIFGSEFQGWEIRKEVIVGSSKVIRAIRLSRSRVNSMPLSISKFLVTA